MPGWRLRARATIQKAIAAHPELHGDPKAMLAVIDAAYPFGERRYTPYKEWLDERAKATDALAREPIHRICRVCGAKPFRPCKDENGNKLTELHPWRLGMGGPNGPLFGES